MLSNLGLMSLFMGVYYIDRHLKHVKAYIVNRLALKSGIDGHLESPQVGHSWPANTSKRLNSVYMVASID